MRQSVAGRRLSCYRMTTILALFQIRQLGRVATPRVFSQASSNIVFTHISSAMTSKTCGLTTKVVADGSRWCASHLRFGINESRLRHHKRHDAVGMAARSMQQTVQKFGIGKEVVDVGSG